MLVVVNQPHINDFKIEGTISPITLDSLKNMFGNYLKVKEEDDEWVDFRDTDWYKEMRATYHPSFYLKYYRKKRKLTLKALAEKLDVLPQNISDMEHERRGISKSMAKKIAKVLDCPVGLLI